MVECRDPGLVVTPADPSASMPTTHFATLSSVHSLSTLHLGYYEPDHKLPSKIMILTSAMSWPKLRIS